MRFTHLLPQVKDDFSADRADFPRLYVCCLAVVGGDVCFDIRVCTTGDLSVRERRSSYVHKDFCTGAVF